MKVLNEAIVGDYHFVISDEYLNISMGGKELVHISYAEAQEVVPWMMGKLGRFAGETATILVPKSAIVPVKPVDVYNGGSVPLDSRTSGQTKPLKVGNPDLAASAASQNNTGQRIVGVETMDLAKEMQKQGIPLLK